MRALTGLAGNRERAEDALQDALVDALKPGRIEGIEHAEPWLYAVAVRHLRRSRLRAALDSAVSALRGRQAAPLGVDRIAALELLEGLTHRQRELVVARYYLDLTYGDIAAQFGISVGTATATVTQAIKKIRRRIEANPEELKAWKSRT